MRDVGITALELATTTEALELEELARVRGVDPAKYQRGLECEQMSLCAPGEDAAGLAVRAARGALEAWGGDPGELGLLVVGTETAADMSRPLSAWVADALELRGAFRSYEVKHACFGGTAAVRQATEWVASGAARGRAALVIATDVATYAPSDPGEPTQGAGAAAMIISEDARLATLEIPSYVHSMPVFDFWRPVGEAHPRVDGKLSLECYKEAAVACFRQWLEEEGEGAFESLGALCFHAPFPKMVKKAFFHVAEELGLGRAERFYEDRMSGHMEWNRRTGNSYTASVWWGLGHALATGRRGERVGVFSYGSGAGAELMFARIGEPLGAEWKRRIDANLDARELLTGEAYLERRGA